MTPTTRPTGPGAAASEIRRRSPNGVEFRVDPRSQAPAWERASSKLRFAIRLATKQLVVALHFDGIASLVVYPIGKQSFQEVRSQAGTWERGKECNFKGSRLGTSVFEAPLRITTHGLMSHDHNFSQNSIRAPLKIDWILIARIRHRLQIIFPKQYRHCYESVVSTANE